MLRVDVEGSEGIEMRLQQQHAAHTVQFIMKQQVREGRATRHLSLLFYSAETQGEEEEEKEKTLTTELGMCSKFSMKVIRVLLTCWSIRRG